MKFIDFLRDKKNYTIAYLVNMVLINLIIFLDVISIDKGSLCYLDMLSIIIFAIFLTVEYLKLNKIMRFFKNNINKENYTPESLDIEYDLLLEAYKKYYKNYYKYINNEYDKLVNKSMLFSDYITSWVHSVKTPVTASKLMIENDVEYNKETLLKVEKELEEILHYTEQALYYVRLDSFSKDYFISEYNLKNIIYKSVKKHSRTFIAKKIAINIEVDDKQVLTDEKWTAFILNQIIYNSLKYTEDCGVIRINTDETVDKLILKISDNGCGIKSEDIGRVFERGFTGFNGRKFEHSTGMGLYLSKQLCELLGHDIKIESKFGEYTTVYITFNKVGYYSKMKKII